MVSSRDDSFVTLGGLWRDRTRRLKVTELVLTLQQVMGMDVTTFGTRDRTSTTMPEILT